jgi:hypothetical protein
MATSGQTAGQRRHPDPWCRDAVDEQHWVADARLEKTDPHGRRRDVDPTLLDVESIRRRNTPLSRPQPGLDPHRREFYAERGDPSSGIACLELRAVCLKLWDYGAS